MAIEVAYASFCDLLKIDRFAQLGLPALEIDLRAFTPDGFEPGAVRAAVLHDLHLKTWLWPRPPAAPVPLSEPSSKMPPEPASGAITKPRLPEEIVTISGRWVSIKEFQSGDIAVKVITYDPDLVSMVKTIARANHGRYSPQWKSWNVPRWRAEAVRVDLRMLAETVSIRLQDKGEPRG